MAGKNESGLSDQQIKVQLICGNLRPLRAPLLNPKRSPINDAIDSVSLILLMQIVWYCGFTVFPYYRKQSAILEHCETNSQRRWTGIPSFVDKMCQINSYADKLIFILFQIYCLMCSYYRRQHEDEDRREVASWQCLTVLASYSECGVIYIITNFTLDIIIFEVGVAVPTHI